MDTQTEQEGLKNLEAIKEELNVVKNRTGGYPRAFVGGILSGIGWVFGGIIALALLGWFLGFIGLIPGFGNLAAYLHQAVEEFNAARQ